MDVFELSSPWTGFLNGAFSYPANPAPAQGLGASVFAYAGRHVFGQIGLQDANGQANRPGVDTFFEEREYFTWAQVGWTPTEERYHDDNLHVTLWLWPPRDPVRLAPLKGCR